MIFFSKLQINVDPKKVCRISIDANIISQDELKKLFSTTAKKLEGRKKLFQFRGTYK